jgi:hypothetical protein
MNNWFSIKPTSYQSFSLSTKNILLPPAPESPMTPITKMPRTSPPMLFLPVYSQSVL